jgi:hypothetical protein
LCSDPQGCVYPSCTSERIIDEGECIDGYRIYKLEYKNSSSSGNGACANPDLCPVGQVIIRKFPCGRNVVSLSFFGTVQLIFSLIIIFVIYFIYALMSVSNK